MQRQQRQRVREHHQASLVKQLKQEKAQNLPWLQREHNIGSEQIDALEIMGINTKTYLILPKISAALIMIPLLVVISMVLGILGGRLAGNSSGILSYDTFDRGLMENFNTFNVWFALIKAYTFAFIISSIPAYYGYHVTGGALEIGRSSTKAVVVSCIMILLADYALAALLL